MFPLVEPFDDAHLDILGNLTGIDDAQDFGQGEAGHGRMLRFFTPLEDEFFQEAVEVVAVDQFPHEADGIVEHVAVRVFQKGNEAVLEETDQGLLFQVLADVRGYGCLGPALLSVAVSPLSHFVEDAAELFPAVRAAQPADELIDERNLIELILPHIGLEQLFRDYLGHAVDDLVAMAIEQFRVIREAQRLFKERRNGEPVGDTADEGRLDDEEQQFFPDRDVMRIPPEENGDEADERQA